MNEKSEWQFLIDYVKDDTTDFGLDSCRNQLLALWTVYCMHNDLDVDTAMYDAVLRNSPDEYVRELRKDEALLNRLVAAAWRAVPFASVHLLDRIMRRNAQKA